MIELAPPGLVVLLWCLVLIVGLTLLSLGLRAGVRQWLLHRRLKGQRRGEDGDRFISELVRVGLSEQRAREVYDYFQSLAAVRDFPVLVSDSLVETYGVDAWGGVSLEEVVEALAPSRALGQRLLGQIEGLATIRDLGVWLASEHDQVLEEQEPVHAA